MLQFPELCGYGLSFCLDGFRMIYASLTLFAWIVSTLSSFEYMKHEKKHARYYSFLFATLFATLGVFLAADFFTVFIFFEMMSFTSYTWVAHTEKKDALKASDTYLGISVIGGLSILMGLFLLYHSYKTLDIATLQGMLQGTEPDGWRYAAGICMLVGFGAKAGAFPMHVWLPKAHPAAPAPTSALLSAVLTKTGIFGILLLSANLFVADLNWGVLLAWISAATMFVGALMAVFSVDIKHTVACSSMSQIGFILSGIAMQVLLGEENALATAGTLLHMMNHTLIKLVLFLSAAVILYHNHSRNLNDLRGFGRKKPLLGACFFVGVLAIGGIPGFSGYISKTLLHESIVEYGGGALMKAFEGIFLLSGGMTLAYMTKLFVAIFIEKNNSDAVQEKYDAIKHYMSPTSAIAVCAPALALLIMGFFPHKIMERVAFMGQGLMRTEPVEVHAHYFSAESLMGGGISIIIGLAIYFVIIRGLLMGKNELGKVEYKHRWPKWLDLEDGVYRPLLLRVIPFLGALFCRVFDSAPDGLVVLLRKTILRDSPIPAIDAPGTAFTRGIGHIMNRVRDIRNCLPWRKTKGHTDYVMLLAEKRAQLRQNNLIITRSVSFGLLLFGIGFTLMLFYLLAGDFKGAFFG